MYPPKWVFKTNLTAVFIFGKARQPYAAITACTAEKNKEVPVDGEMGGFPQYNAAKMVVEQKGGAGIGQKMKHEANTKLMSTEYKPRKSL